MPSWASTSPACAALTTADVAGAQALVKGAGADLRGLEVPLSFNDEPGSGNAELMAAVGKQWQDAFGIVPRLVPLPWTQFHDQALAGQGFDHPFRTSWRSTVPAPSSFLRSQLSSAAIGSTNLTRFSERSYDVAYEFGLERETDPKARAKLFPRVVQQLCLLAPMVPLWAGTDSYLVRDTVSAADGHLQRPAFGDLNVRELSLKSP
jgi:ABC-type oligopeptide transport system substrate-binding subunit